MGSISGHNLHDLKITLPVTGIFAHDFGGIASGLSKKERTISVEALVENSLVGMFTCVSHLYTCTRYVRVLGCVVYDAAIDTNIPLSLAESAHALACTLSPPVNARMRITHTAMQRHRHRLTNKNSRSYA